MNSMYKLICLKKSEKGVCWSKVDHMPLVRAPYLTLSPSILTKAAESDRYDARVIFYQKKYQNVLFLN